MNDGINKERYPCVYPQILCVGNSDLGSPVGNSNFGDWVNIAARG